MCISWPPSSSALPGPSRQDLSLRRLLFSCKSASLPSRPVDISSLKLRFKQGLGSQRRSKIPFSRTATLILQQEVRRVGCTTIQRPLIRTQEPAGSNCGSGSSAAVALPRADPLGGGGRGLRAVCSLIGLEA